MKLKLTHTPSDPRPMDSRLTMPLNTFLRERHHFHHFHPVVPGGERVTPNWDNIKSKLQKL